MMRVEGCGDTLPQGIFEICTLLRLLSVASRALKTAKKN